MYFDNLSRWQALLAAARGDRPADVLLANANIVNVFAGQVEFGSIALSDGCIAGIGDYKALEMIDLQSAYIAPGLIEGHIHIESSKLTPRRFAEAVAPHGTTAAIADPHEIANVWGVEGLRYMMNESRGLPLDIFYMLPPCVPATAMETAGARLSVEDLKMFGDEPNVIGLAEMMNFPGTYSGDADMLSKAALFHGRRPIDGHSPGLSGYNLNAYLAAGPATDHECNALEEAREKLARGMRIMLREGSTARNLKTLAPLVIPATERRCLLVSDDRRASDLHTEGHLDYILRQAVKAGIDPLTAIRMVTLNAAETYDLKYRGGIRPGWKADLVVFNNLEEFIPLMVWKDGCRIAEHGKLIVPLQSESHHQPLRLCVPPLESDAFEIPDKQRPVRVIRLVPDKIITHSVVCQPKVSAGMLISDIENDIVKLVVVERYSGAGRSTAAFVQGFELKCGAIGSTVAHDSHNIIAAGIDDNSIHTAVRRLTEIGGGQVATLGDRILAELPLPIAGLMSDEPLANLVKNENILLAAASQLGCPLKDPFMALSFLALPVIPELKLTDQGLVDVNEFKIVPLYV